MCLFIFRKRLVITAAFVGGTLASGCRNHGRAVVPPREGDVGVDESLRVEFRQADREK